MKKAILVFITVLISVNFYSQNDSAGVRNYVGLNISSTVSRLLGGDDAKPIRFGGSYRRCIGLYNLKIAFVGLNDFYPGYSGANFSYTLNDTIRAKINANTTNKSRDLRIGLERKWGSKTNKIFLGAGIVVGKYTYEERYTEHYYDISSDSVGFYSSNDFSSYEWGEDKSQYFKIGINVWAGVAWDIGDHFNFMIQINPDISNYSLLKNEREDPVSRFPITQSNFTYMALSSIDLMIGVRL